MSEEDKSSKTEKPTPKKIRDARNKGDVPKSKDLASTAGTLVWVLIMVGASNFWVGQLGELVNRTFTAMQRPFEEVMYAVMVDAVRVLLLLGLVPLVISSSMGTFIEFLQVRGVIAFEKVKPDLNHLNPAKGFKKVFSMDNVVELIKSVIKTTILIAIFLAVMHGYMDSVIKLPYATPGAVGSLWWKISLQFSIWVLVLFFFVAAFDMVFQQNSFMKKLRMSRRDIKQEMKDDEGDPYVRQRRKQLHQEWSDQNMLSSVRRSNVVVTNPTHYAVALRYEKGDTDVPMVIAKGEDHMARLIKETALQEGIPIMENVMLARSLHAQVEIDDFIPTELFEAVAEVLIWAQSIRAEEEANASAQNALTPLTIKNVEDAKKLLDA
jgi:type III secretion protein U